MIQRWWVAPLALLCWLHPLAVSRAEEFNVERTFQAQDTAVNAIAFSPDGQVLISGGGHNDGRLRIWSLKSGKLVETTRSQSLGVVDLLLSARQGLLISAGEDSEVHLWAFPDGEFQQTLRYHTANVLDLTLTPDETVLISAGLGGVRLWDLDQQRPLYTLVRFQAIAAIAVHPNGYTLAAGTLDGTVQLWNLRTGSLLTSFPAHTAAIAALQFSPDGDTLITASEDRTLILWDLATGQQRATLRGHTGGVRAIALTPDGDTLISGSHDGIRLWSMLDGALLQHWNGHQDWVMSLAVHPNGRQFASGDLQGQIKLWSWPPDLPNVAADDPNQ
ncbi:WD40 repeat domain-containing protein [Spirulina major]|uniref:WD40 repeat domain-containing protein n=1 Tax=Spirulina major TaxID=270636 RepID=UPI000934C65C|nr:WD40 repeat domain-containing protein [Spirulina major]